MHALIRAGKGARVQSAAGLEGSASGTPPAGGGGAAAMAPQRDHHRRIQVATVSNLSAIALVVALAPLWVLARVAICSGPGGGAMFDFVCGLNLPLTAVLLLAVVLAAVLVVLLLQFEDDHHHPILLAEQRRLKFDARYHQEPVLPRGNHYTRLRRTLRYPGTPHRRKASWSLWSTLLLTAGLVALVLLSGVMA